MLTLIRTSHSSAAGQGPRRALLSGDNRVVRNSYQQKFLQWNPFSPRGEDHSVVANHTCGLCHIHLSSGKCWYCQPPDSPSQVLRGHWCHCGVLINKDTCERDVTTQPIMALAKYHAEKALEGIRRRDE